MNKVKLITSKNDVIIPVLMEHGFMAEELLFSSDIHLITKDIYTLLEIPELNADTAERIEGIVKSLHETSGIICFCETITRDIKGFLLKNGLADCIEGSDPGRISRYIQLLSMPCMDAAGTFLILDDNSTHKKMLESIIKRFGYNINFISSIDELFEMTGDPENIMLLINMGTGKLDMNAVVRRSYNNTDIKKIPVIAFKSMEQGLFVHEIINGLNRLTKIILSPEELYCMLTDMLFKKEIMSYTSVYTGLIKYAGFFSYAEKSIQQIYYEIQQDPCGQDSLFGADRINSIIESAEKIRKSLIKIEGIKWLSGQGTSGKQLTCGGGV